MSAVNKLQILHQISSIEEYITISWLLRYICWSSKAVYLLWWLFFPKIHYFISTFHIFPMSISPLTESLAFNFFLCSLIDSLVSRFRTLSDCYTSGGIINRTLSNSIVDEFIHMGNILFTASHIARKSEAHYPKLMQFFNVWEEPMRYQPNTQDLYTVFVFHNYRNS